MCLYVTSGFRIETMYVYYIATEIYVLGCMSIFSNLFIVYVQLVCHIIYYELNTNTTKTIQNQKFESLHNFLPSNFAFIQQKSFYQVKVFLKVTNTHIYILTKKKLNKKFLKVYTSHGFQCDFTCIIKCKNFHIN